MTTQALTIADISLFAGIAASTFTVLSLLLKWLSSYLSAKLGIDGAKGVKELEAARRIQSDQCRFDLANVASSIQVQNTTIEKLLKQNQFMLEAMKDAAHINELRHQIILAKLDRLDDRLNSQKN
jgi:deferrochelatase/peroxidase EfeB